MENYRSINLKFYFSKFQPFSVICKAKFYRIISLRLKIFWSRNAPCIARWTHVECFLFTILQVIEISDYMFDFPRPIGRTIKAAHSILVDRELFLLFSYLTFMVEHKSLFVSYAKWNHISYNHIIVGEDTSLLVSFSQKVNPW